MPSGVVVYEAIDNGEDFIIKEFNLSAESIEDISKDQVVGFQLSKEIKKIRPEVPIIICTGYSEQIDEEKCKAFGIEGFIMKPMIKRELAMEIRKALGSQMAYHL